MTDAVISGSAGLAFFSDGTGIWSLRKGAAGLERLPRHRHDIPALLGDAQDLAFLEDVDEKAVLYELDLARAGVQAIHLALMLCDPTTAGSTVALATGELHDLLARASVAERAERILDAKPMQAPFDLGMAVERCRAGGRERAASFFEALAKRQPAIREVRRAWDILPSVLFSRGEDRAFADGLLAREGMFRSLVRAHQTGASLDVWLAAARVEPAVTRAHAERYVEVWAASLRAMAGQFGGASVSMMAGASDTGEVAHIARLSAREARLIEAASRALSCLPASAPIVAIFDAIRPCLPFSAGFLSVIRPGAPDALVSHAVRLPPDVLESWISTPADQLVELLSPVVASRPGDLQRNSEVIPSALRKELKLLRELDAAGLGEGAWYKALERVVPWHPHRVEHIVLALIMGRGEAIPSRSRAMLAVLNPAIRDAVLRCGLPLATRAPIFAQLMEEQSLGYVCVSLHGTVIEANRRAYDLVLDYRSAAGLEGRRSVLAEFASRAQENAGGGRALHLRGRRPSSFLHVSVHRLAKEAHALPEDVALVVMTETPAQQPAERETHGLAKLTSRQREIALLVARTRASYKQIAQQLSLREATVLKHMQRIHRELGVHSRAELAALLHGHGTGPSRSRLQRGPRLSSTRHPS